MPKTFGTPCILFFPKEKDSVRLHAVPGYLNVGAQDDLIAGAQVNKSK